MNKQEYGIGDWIYYNYNLVDKEGGEIHRIIEIKGDQVVTNMSEYFCSYKLLNNGNYQKSVRKAHEHEIPAEYRIQDKIVNNYDIY